MLGFSVISFCWMDFFNITLDTHTKKNMYFTFLLKMLQFNYLDSWCTLNFPVQLAEMFYDSSLDSL